MNIETLLKCIEIEQVEVMYRHFGYLRLADAMKEHRAKLQKMLNDAIKELEAKNENEID